MEPFNEIAQKNFEKIDNKSKFNVNDIVYLLPDFNKGASVHYPAINSPAEIDLKVLAIYGKPAPAFVPETNIYYYDLLSGHEMYVSGISEGYLISAKEKVLGMNKEILILKEDTELAKAGTLFVHEGDYWCNDGLGISVHQDRITKILNLFETYKQQR